MAAHQTVFAATKAQRANITLLVGLVVLHAIALTGEVYFSTCTEARTLTLLV